MLGKFGDIRIRVKAALSARPMTETIGLEYRPWHFDAVLEFPMICNPLTHLARFAVVVVAIVLAVLPHSSMGCTHCLLHSVSEFADSHAHAGQSPVDHACDSCCSGAIGHHLEDSDHSPHDCPCCIGGLENTPLFTSPSTHIVDVTSAAPAWLEFERRQTPVMLVQCLEAAEPVFSPHLPNVLRI